MKRLFIIMAVFTLIFTGCSKVDTTGKDLTVLVVGMECEYPPYNKTVSEQTDTSVPIDGQVTYCDGYDVQIAKSIAEDLGVDLVVKQLPWDGLIPALETGQIDAIIAGMSPTEERAEVVDFSDSYYTETTNMGIVVEADSKYADATSLEDFNGATLSAQTGTFHVELLDQIDGVDIAPSQSDFSVLLESTLSGVIDGYVSEESTGISAENSGKNLVFVSFEEGNGFELKPEYNTVSIAVKKGREDLLNQINEALAGISPEEREEIMNSYLEEE